MAGPGLRLARGFYSKCLEPLLRRYCPGIFPYIALGLVGEGSECLNCDDEISRDHDWGAGCCLWLPAEDMATLREPLSCTLELLPRSYSGHPVRHFEPGSRDRLGPWTVEGFYKRYTGLDRPPASWREWLPIPEHFLAVCTNGEVFHDGPGLFTSHRAALLDFYPDDVLRHKIAARCAVMAQAGQYNLPRSWRREDAVAPMLCAARFAEAALSLLFLLHRRYMPFYKWAHRLARSLPRPGETVAGMLETLARSGPNGAMVEEICAALATELRARGLSSAPGDWMLSHGASVAEGITDTELQAIPYMRA